LSQGLTALSPQEADDFFDELEEGWRQGVMDDRISDAVYDYTGSTAARINTALRSRNVSDADKRLVRRLDRAMEAGWADRPVPLFRGVPARAWEEIANHNEGDVITDRGFLSTSLDRGKAEEFASGGGGVLEIAAPKDQQMVPAAGIGEMEILLPRRTKLRIRSIDRENRVVVLDPVPAEPG
jgi:hypothetical protein